MCLSRDSEPFTYRARGTWHTSHFRKRTREPTGSRTRQPSGRAAPPRSPRPLAGILAVNLLGAAIALAGWILLSSPSAPQRAVAAVARGCPTPAAASRASRALGAAKRRYLTEAQGAVIHADLRQIANDPILLGALSAGNLNAALAEADRQLVRHVVQIRVLRGSRVLLDANSTSFDVEGRASNCVRGTAGASGGWR